MWCVVEGFFLLVVNMCFGGYCDCMVGGGVLGVGWFEVWIELGLIFCYQVEFQ